MIKTRTYNTKTTQVKGWATADKRGHIEVIDTLTGYAFCIDLKKNPRITIFENSDEHNFGSCVTQMTINKGKVTVSN